MKAPIAFGNAKEGDTCSGCGYFSDARGAGVCHFTGEKAKDQDKAAGCAGFHVGNWWDLWAVEGRMK